MEYKEMLENKKKVDLEIESELDKIHTYERKIAYHEKRLAKIRDEKGGMWNCILYPLIEEIKKRCGFEYAEIYGPFGICAETSIYFSHIGRHREKGDFHYGLIDDIEITKVETWCLKIQPNDKVESGYEYFTGQTTNRFPKGTIGELNGMNNIYAELPTDINKIIRLLTYSKGRSE